MTSPRASLDGGELRNPRLLLCAAVAAAAAGTAAVRAPALTAAGVAAVAVAALALVRFEAAVGLFTALTFFERAPGLTGAVPVVKLMTLVLVAAWIALAMAGRRLPLVARDEPAVAVAMLLLAGWAAASTLWAADPAAAASGAFRLLQMFAIVFLVFATVRNGADLRSFAWAFIAGSVLTSIIPLAGIGPAVSAPSGARFGGYLGNPNNLAAVELPALALSGFMLISARRSLERIVLSACGIAMLATLLLTQSRGGLVGLGAMAAAAVAFAGPARRPAVRLVVGAAVCAVVYFELLASSAARQRATEFAGSESTGRLDLWHVAWRMFDAHPLHGVGLDNFIVLAPGYLANDIDIQRADLFLRSVATQVHNTYLTVLVELGLIGELLFVSFLVGVTIVAARALRALARSGDRDTELLGRGLVVGVVGMLTAYVFFSAQYEKQLWLILGALLSLATVARGTQASSRATRR